MRTGQDRLYTLLVGGQSEPAWFATWGNEGAVKRSLFGLFGEAQVQSHSLQIVLFFIVAPGRFVEHGLMRGQIGMHPVERVQGE